MKERAVTRELAIKALGECQASTDTEAAHVDADVVLCQLLAALGYADVVSAWEKVDKWYA